MEPSWEQQSQRGINQDFKRVFTGSEQIPVDTDKNNRNNTMETTTISDRQIRIVSTVYSQKIIEEDSQHGIESGKNDYDYLSNLTQRKI